MHALTTFLVFKFAWVMLPVIYCRVTLQVYKSKISHFQVAPSLRFKARVSEAIDKNHFHKKGFVVSLTLIVRVFGTRKWPVRLNGKFAILTAI